MRRLLWLWLGTGLYCGGSLGCNVVDGSKLPLMRSSGPDQMEPTREEDPECTQVFCAFRTARAQDSCVAAAPAPKDLAIDPETSMSIADEEPFYVAVDRLWIGETTLEGMYEPSSAWISYGFDLDGGCTNSATCPDSMDTPLCQPAGAAMAEAVDANYCADNSFARLGGLAAMAPGLGPALGLTDTDLNCSLRRGDFSLLIRISDYNGLPDDNQVRVDLYSSAGLEEKTSLECPSADPLSHTHWLASTPWYISRSGLVGVAPAGQVLPNSMFAITDAYVVDGFLVGELPTGYDLVLHGDRSPYPGWEIQFATFRLVGKLVKGAQRLWEIEQGSFSGVQLADELLLSFRQVGVCGQQLDLVKMYVDEYADMPAKSGQDPLQPCAAVSTNLAFSAFPARPGKVEDTLPRLDCCVEENTVKKGCLPACGDGVVQIETERCDIAIEPGKEGACPTECEQTGADPCRPILLKQDDCRTECVETEPIVALVDGDGCCPAGASSVVDKDCSAVCGNGIVEGMVGELCDPLEACPTQETCQQSAGDACIDASVVGEPEMCTAACQLVERGCVDDDDCCGVGCDVESDNDCSVTCGNRSVEESRGELCDGNCPTECGDDEDDDACTHLVYYGSSESCNARCVSQTITQCRPGDGCCPQGCGSLSDSDCVSVCGNTVREPGEDCDDGNRTSGDGCSEDCKSESGVAECLGLATPFFGEDDPVCNNCACGKCADEFVTCLDAEDETDAELCTNLVVCGLTTGCRATECVLSCQAEIIAAGKVDSISDPNLASLYEANDNPLGWAGRISNCIASSCDAECPAMSE